MVFTTPSCKDTVWNVAQVMTRVIPDRELTESFCTPKISQQEQLEMQEGLAESVLAASENADNADLKYLLECHSSEPEEQRELVDNAIRLLARAYSSCSSVYPRDWFAKFRQRMLSVNGEEPPAGELVFIAPPALDAKEAVA